MEYPAPRLDLHVDLGVRGADDHMAYRTMPAPSSPDPRPRDGLRQDSALNLCHDGLINRAHGFPPTGVIWRVHESAWEAAQHTPGAKLRRGLAKTKAVARMAPGVPLRVMPL